nr:ribonuclease H-like domain-containing protein [Tanacetum cinerariifolium]
MIPKLNDYKSIGDYKWFPMELITLQDLFCSSSLLKIEFYGLEQRLDKKNDLKAKGTLLMAILDKHQLKFNIHKDAKSLMETIEKSQLEILDETISQKDIDLKFLRSLPSEWKTPTLIWRNKSNLEEQSLDDLFNNLLIYEAEVKGSSTSSQNTAYLSSNNTDNTNESVSDVPSVSAASSKATVSTLPNVDSLKNDRYKTGERYHVVPPPYTKTFMPLKPDLVFNDAHTASESVANVVNVELSINKPSKDMSMTLRPDAPIIEDWTSDSENETGIESGNPQQALKDKGVIDSGCLRHMTGNISFLSYFEEINGGYVAFGRNPKGGKITGKGRIKTGFKENLDAGKVGKETISAQQYVLIPLWSTGLQDPQNTNADVADAAFDVKESENDVHVSASGSNKTKKHDDKAKRDNKGKNRLKYPDDPDMPELEDIVYSDDEKDIASTPIETEKPLLKDPDGEDVDVHIYRYLKGKPDLGLWYPKDSPFNLMAYFDSDYARASLDRKFTTVKSWLVQSKRLLAFITAVSFKLMLFGLTKDAAVNLMLLDDTDGVECLPNEEIFTELARMGYEKPPPKLTFYNVFFSTQWKFLIHTLVQCVSVKRTAWNEFSYSMASVVICLATCRKFNFFKYIFDSM